MPATPEVLQTIRAARDSVWVIEDSLAKVAAGATLSNELRGNIERNVEHLKLVVGNPNVLESGEDISDLHNAITQGNATIA
jgi:hypothetical protein